MSEQSWPWAPADPDDPGATPGAAITEGQWRRTNLAVPPGVLFGFEDDLEGYADSTGMHVKVRAGRAHCWRHYYESDTEVEVPISANASGSTRHDRVVVRFDFEAKTAELFVVEGPDDLAADLDSQYDVPVLKVAVPPGAVTIANADAKDDRRRSSAFGGSHALIGKSGQGSLNNAEGPIGFDVVHYDTDAFFDAAVNDERLIVPEGRGGLYYVRASVRWPVNTAGIRLIRVRKNSGASDPNNAANACPALPGSVTHDQSMSTSMVLDDGDYVDVTVYQNSGSTLVIATSYLSIARIGAA